VHTLLDHLISIVVRNYDAYHLNFTLWGFQALEDLAGAVLRIPLWIRRHYLIPMMRDYIHRIALLKTWTSFWITRVWVLELQLYAAAKRYAAALTAAERQQRIKADQVEHAAMLKAIAQALATVQSEAASGYRAGNHQRVSAISKITDDLANRNPVVRGIVSTMVRILLDFLGTENPVERAAVGFLLTQVINRLGVDKVAGELLGALLGPLLGNANPKNLHDVTDDLAARVSALEGQWARYMTDGGPELDQAGRDWKRLTGLSVDAAMLAFFATAVAAPEQWAREVNNTAGRAVNGTIDTIASLIRRV
jgi:hypothetical protein